MSACYRSKHKDVMTVWDDSQARWREARDKIAAFKKKYASKSANMLVTTGTEYRLVGIAMPYDKPPKGGELAWRYETKKGCWVPRRSVKEGKAIAKELDACGARNLGDLPGLPHFVQTKVGLFNLQGFQAFGHGGYVYACYPSVDHEDVVKSGWGTFDDKLWKQIKRSQYEAANEKREAEEKARAA